MDTSPPPLPRTPGGTGTFFDAYTQGLTTEELERLFTRDAPEAYRFFAQHIDFKALAHLPWHKRTFAQARLLFLAFTLKLTPARRAIYGMALVAAIVGLIELFRSVHLWIVPHPAFVPGTLWLLAGFLLLNLLVLLEVADRLSLKNDLEIARQIQQAMLPKAAYEAPGIEAFGMTRPANTVGGDFYDVIPLADGRVLVALGDVAGKGSPAALLMALLLAMLRTLVDEGLEPAELVTRLNVQVSRHAPGTRFITLLYAIFDPKTGVLTYVNAGHMPPLLLRNDGRCTRLTEGGIALGMFDHSTYTTGQVTIQCDELVAIYSDGITEAENPSGRPFDEAGLESALVAHRHDSLSSIGAAVVRAVEQYTADTRLADDLTILLLRRCTMPTAVGV